MRAGFYIAFVLVIYAAILAWGIHSMDSLGAEWAKFKDMANDRTALMVFADLYAGFLILAGWIIYRDGFGLKAVLIIALMLVLGNIVPLLYILFLLIQTRGDVWQTLLGRRT
ncbi:hypothetical protein [Robiginitomaculum antarcticum]|uniref:hypothetical protein n=1 Tax=Robiginitomaculum antarcticum TaxID=437507 RepID=UPI0003620135|nr:hypothetical protein [Robiginitomaculum antarcticum]